jgi:uncharacterized protein (TIGR02996 family)
MNPDMTLDELYQKVIEDPDADAPRVAYAAACDLAGNRDRADFIRLQMESAERIRRGASNWWEFVDRKLELRDANGEAWAGPIQTRVDGYEFFRGFVECITIDAKQFLASAEELYRLAPIRRLRLTNVAPVVEELFNSPHLSRIVSLTMEVQHLSDREVEVLARSPYLRKLAWLCLRVNDITMVGVEAMAASSALPALVYVDFWFNPVHELVREAVGIDQGQIVWIGTGLIPLEHTYGRKAWLHTVEDRGREVFEEEF